MFNLTNIFHLKKTGFCRFFYILTPIPKRKYNDCLDNDELKSKLLTRRFSTGKAGLSFLVVLNPKVAYCTGILKSNSQRFFKV